MSLQTIVWSLFFLVAPVVYVLVNHADSNSTATSSQVRRGNLIWFTSPG
ncbi:MAG: hypothetical protein VX768_18065 [Planctomycetota bacterium]|nr:hypothetical protein [Planctomycetota bacterium]